MKTRNKLFFGLGSVFLAVVIGAGAVADMFESDAAKDVIGVIGFVVCAVVFYFAMKYKGDK